MYFFVGDIYYFFMAPVFGVYIVYKVEPNLKRTVLDSVFLALELILEETKRVKA